MGELRDSTPRRGFPGPVGGSSGPSQRVEGEWAGWFRLCAAGPAQGCRWFSPFLPLQGGAPWGDRPGLGAPCLCPLVSSLPLPSVCLSPKPLHPHPSQGLPTERHGQTDRCHSPRGARHAPPSPPLSVAALWPPVVSRTVLKCPSSVCFLSIWPFKDVPWPQAADSFSRVLWACL